MSNQLHNLHAFHSRGLYFFAAWLSIRW